MELKEFIKGVLSDIANAVKESQEELKEIAVVNPPNNVSTHPMGGKVSSYDKHTIDFDIAVSASSEKDKGVGIKVFSAIGGEMASNSTSQEYSRIKFSIPVYLSRGEIGDFHIYVDKKTDPSPSYAEPTAKVKRNG